MLAMMKSKLTANSAKFTKNETKIDLATCMAQETTTTA